MAGKQYCFKSTLYTEYIEDIIEDVPKKFRSEFIRRHFILGLETAKHSSSTNVHPKVNKGSTKVEPEPTFIEKDSKSDDEDILDRLDNSFN